MTKWGFMVLCGLLASTFGVVFGEDADARSVYAIAPAIDGPALGVASLGATLPVVFQKRIVHQTDPGNPNDVNSFDRHVIGNHSDLAAWTSHFTVALAIAAPLALDYKDLGFS